MTTQAQRSTTLDPGARALVTACAWLRDGQEPPPGDVARVTDEWRPIYDALSHGAAVGRFGAVLQAYNTGETAALVKAIERAPSSRSLTLADLAALLPSISHLWEGRLPRGSVTLLVAKPGKGKSAVAAWLARSVILGKPWPDAAPNTTPPGKVVWTDTEAAQAILLDRARRWQIPLDHIIMPSVSQDDPLTDVLLDTPAGRDALEREVSRHAPPLVVVDSLSGSHRQDEKSSLQDLMSFLASLARDRDIAVLVVHHLRKRGVFDDVDTIDLDQIRGHGSIAAMARVILAIDTPDAGNLDRHRLSVIKNNLGPRAAPLGFTVTDAGLVFGDAPEPPRAETSVDRAVEFLRARLTRKPIEAEAIITEAEQAGITRSTLQRGKDALGIKPQKIGASWWWSLPVGDIS